MLAAVRWIFVALLWARAHALAASPSALRATSVTMDSSGMPKLRLVYFAVRARAEAAQMMLHYAGIPYEYVNCNQAFGKSFKEAKESGVLPLGTLPVLEINSGTLLGQSGAINRYIAKLAGLYPENPLLAAQADCIADTAEDLSSINPITNVFRGDTWRQKSSDYFNGPWAKYGGKVSAMLGDKPYFLGDRPYFCDFVMYHPLDLVRVNKPEALKPFPNLSGFLGRMEALPGTSHYLKTRPVCVDMGTNPRLVSPEEGKAMAKK